MKEKENDNLQQNALTIYDISEKAGVSIATVSRVLNGSRKVSPNVSTDSPNRITISDSSRFPIILNKSFNPLSEPSRRFAVRRASQTGAGFGQARAALPETARQIFLLHRKKRSFRRSRSKAPQYIRRQRNRNRIDNSIQHPFRITAKYSQTHIIL